MKQGSQKNPPKSATSQIVALSGLLSFFATLTFVRQFDLTNVEVTTICMAGTALPMLVLEIFVLKVFRKSSSGLNLSNLHRLNAITIKRIMIKWIGLNGTLSLIAFLYWLFPEYSRDFYAPFWSFLQSYLPIFLLMSVPYFIYVDRCMIEPEDGYYLAGNLFLGRYQLIHNREFQKYFLGWVIKGFFLPLMFVYFGNNIDYLFRTPIDYAFRNFPNFVAYVGRVAVGIDLAFVSIGYVLTLRLTNSHIRSPNQLIYGWFFTLLMYAPFFSLFGNKYLDYKDGLGWLGLFGTDNAVVVYVWGSTIIFTKLMWAWSNVSFGIRFSNLTNRGIITNGPYRLMRHPSYFFKNISWWLLAVPFASTEGSAAALRYSILFLGINFVYYLRAKAEEKHLSEEPTYVEYALWIEENGILRWMRRILPFVRYNQPEQR